MTPVTVEMTDEHTGKTHRFVVDTDNYGVRITHQDTGHQAVLEVFDDKVRCLAYVKDSESEEPAVNFLFP